MPATVIPTSQLVSLQLSSHLKAAVSNGHLTNASTQEWLSLNPTGVYSLVPCFFSARREPSSVPPTLFQAPHCWVGRARREVARWPWHKGSHHSSPCGHKAPSSSLGARELGLAWTQRAPHHRYDQGRTPWLPPFGCFLMQSLLPSNPKATAAPTPRCFLFLSLSSLRTSP